MFLKIRTDRIVRNMPSTVLGDQAQSSATALTVFSNSQFSGTNKYLFIGKPGSAKSEIVTYTSNTGNTTINCGALKFSHPAGTPVYLINANQVKFSRATTPSGSYSTLTTIAINPESEFTIYEDTANTTGYGQTQFYNQAAAAAYGQVWEIIRYAEDTDRKTRGYVKQSAVEEVNAVIDGVDLTEDFLNRKVSQCDDRLRDEKLSWKEETGHLVIPTSIGVSSYDLSTYIKDTKTKNSLHFVKYGSQELPVVEEDVFKNRLGSALKTTLATSITTLSTTIVLTDSSDFDDEGSIQIEDDTIYYSANNRSTNTLSGISGIDSNHSSGVEVWQGIESGQPDTVTIIDGYLNLYPVITKDEDAKNLDIIYAKTYTPITLDSDELAFPAHLYIDFLKIKIAEKKGDKDLGSLKADWERDVIKYRVLDSSSTEVKFAPDPRQVLYPSSRRGRLD